MAISALSLFILLSRTHAQTLIKTHAHTCIQPHSQTCALASPCKQNEHYISNIKLRICIRNEKNSFDRLVFLTLITLFSKKQDTGFGKTIYPSKENYSEMTPCTCHTCYLIIYARDSQNNTAVMVTNVIK